MRKMGRKLVIATILIALGAIIFIGGMIMNNWNFNSLSTRKMQTKEYKISDDFTDISIKGDTADIIFAISDDEKCKVVCFEEKNAAHSVAVEGGVLTIAVNDEKSWLDYIGFNFSSPSITVYLPEGAYGELKIENSTGDIELPKEIKLGSIDISLSTGDVDCKASVAERIKINTSTGDINLTDVSAEVIELSVSTGHITAAGIDCVGDISLSVSTGKSQLSDVKCGSLTSTGNTGDITLTGVVALGKFSIERTTGDVKLVGSDAGEIYIETDTGKVSGSLLSEKIFIPRTSTGSIDVPKTTSGGICEITTSTGDIKITIN